jgi:hypothetical protein
MTAKSCQVRIAAFVFGSALAVLSGSNASKPLEMAGEVALVHKARSNRDFRDRHTGSEKRLCLLYSHLHQINVRWDAEMFSKASD